jgi:glucose-6-phosphate dehydrogenase assembly protein OpcA
MIGATQAPIWSGHDVDVTTIERRLAELWTHLPAGSDNPAGVRTHMFNLVVYADSSQQLARVSRLIELAGRHPSRAIILTADRSPIEPSVDAELTLRCRSGPGGTATYCHEQAVLALRGRAADHPSSVVMPLLMPELPTYLWWPGQPPFGFSAFNRLLTVAEQLIVDSAEFDSPGVGLTELARLCTRRYGINDFHWARLTPWREVFAQFFEGEALIPYMDAIRAVSVEFGSGPGQLNGVTAGLLLIVGWLASRLGWEPETTLNASVAGDTRLTVLQGERLIPIDLRFGEHGAQSAGRLMCVEVVAQPADRPPGRFRITRLDSLFHVNVTMEIHGKPPITRVFPLGMKTEEQLLSEELELAGVDVLYSEVVHHASRLAGRDVWMPT